MYLALDRRLERKVAIKVLRPRFARSPHFRNQLQDEAKRIAQIRSDYVVEVYDVRCQEDNSLQFIVMEYVEGCSLSAYLENRRNGGESPEKDPREVVQWLYQAALGVQVIHQRGYSHNDLKQGNLLIELMEPSASGASGKNCRVKIADFGLLQSLSVEERKTGTDTAGGTETYMSPQRLESPADIDTRDDIYSLGVVLYHLLTGTMLRTIQFLHLKIPPAHRPECARWSAAEISDRRLRRIAWHFDTLNFPTTGTFTLDFASLADRC